MGYLAGLFWVKVVGKAMSGQPCPVVLAGGLARTWTRSWRRAGQLGWWMDGGWRSCLDRRCRTGCGWLAACGRDAPEACGLGGGRHDLLHREPLHGWLARLSPRHGWQLGALKGGRVFGKLTSLPVFPAAWEAGLWFKVGLRVVGVAGGSTQAGPRWSRLGGSTPRQRRSGPRGVQGGGSGCGPVLG